MAKELVHAIRGDLVESIVRGDVAVVDHEGTLLYEVGSPKEKVTYFRSSAKPIQALAVVESGAVDHFGLTELEMAIFCASHSGEKEHVSTVKSILNKIGLDPAKHLQCGVHPPIHRDSLLQMVLNQETPYEVHCNCSGKHSGMLTLAQYKGYPLEDYIKINHPVQQAMLHTMADLAGLAAEDIVIGIDGCGVPVHGMSVYHMAQAWANLVQPVKFSQKRQESAMRIAEAMLNHPHNVAGSGRFCTDLMSVTNRKFIGKSGASGVYCVGLRDKGWAIAVKAEDGNGQAASSVIVEVLRQLDQITEEELKALQKYHKPEIRNHRNDLCGYSKPIFTLTPVTH